MDNLNLERPPIGYFSVPRIYQSERPRPEPFKYRDYKAEAAEYVKELPPDYPVKKEYKRYGSHIDDAFY